MKRAVGGWALVVAFAGTLLLLGLTGPARAADGSVTVDDDFYSPSSVGIEVGDRVVWTWEGSSPHTVTFDGVAGEPNDCPMTSTGGATCSRTFSTAGTYPYHCAVHPSMTGSVSVQAPPAPSNDPPFADFTVAKAGLTVSVDATASTDPDGTVVGFAWDFGDGGTATGATASHAYAADGTYTILLTVTDDAGATDSVARATRVDAPPNVKPVAAFHATVEGRVATVEHNATDPDGTIVSFVWDWGDGTPPATGPSPDPHAYATIGTKTITLTVTDDAGATALATRQVEVVNAPPLAAFTVSASGRVVRVDANASGDPDGAIVAYRWSWGDGGPDATGAAPPAHAYVPGTWTIVLTVTDDLGASANASHDVTIQNALPVAAFTLDATELTVRVDAGGSTDSDGEIVSFAWTFGDGAAAGGPSANHTYLAQGGYEVTLTVRDDDGAVRTVTRFANVTASPIAPAPEGANATPTGPDPTTGPPPTDQTPAEAPDGTDVPAPGVLLLAALVAALAVASRRRPPPTPKTP